MVARGGFEYRGDHLICPQGKALRRGAFHNRDRIFQYVARHKDCRACPVRPQCLPANQKRHYVALSMDCPLFLAAQARNQTAAFRREQNRRRTVAEGTFASLDRLDWEKSRRRGL